MNNKRLLTALTFVLVMTIALAFGQQPVAAQATLTVGIDDPSINADGLCSLEEAVANANNNAATYTDCPAGTSTGTDTIDLDGRTITFSTALAGYDLDGHNALPPIADELIITNGTIERDAALTVCDGGAGDRTEFRLINNQSTLTLDGITLQNGCASDSAAFVSVANDVIGGAIFNFATLTITNSTITGNTADSLGGGIYNFGNTNISASNITSNISGGPGGGIANYANMTIDGTTISGNQSQSGGGIRSVSSPSGDTLNITNSTISGNTATVDGGGISTFVDMTIDNTTITNNSAVNGGGISVATLTVTTITDSTITLNTATNGGGIYNLSLLTIDATIISGNSATDGGGIHTDNGGNNLYTNVLLSGNSASNVGGGFYALSSSGEAFHNSTIASNAAPNGSAGYLTGTGNLAIYNTISWNNTFDLSTYTGTTESGYSITEEVFAGTGNLVIDPMFVSPLASTSAPTTGGDYSLQLNSPAIDSASNTIAIATGFVDGVTVDVVGSDRFVDDPGVIDTGDGTAPIIDMGAYELQGVSNLAPTADFAFVCTGLACDFDASPTSTSPSTDTDGTITDYDWDFNDASFGIGAIISHTFPAAGDYDVELVVTDDDGATGTIIQTVTVQNLPVIAAIGDQTVAEGYTINIPISASDADGQIPSLSVSSVDIATPGTFIYSFVDNTDGTGTLTVSPQLGVTPQTYVMTFTADDGIEQSTLDFNLIVTDNPAPVITTTLNDVSVSEGQTFTINITATDDSSPTVVDIGTLIYDSGGNLIDVSPLGANVLFYSVVNNGDGTGTLTITPQAGDELNSPYVVEVSALDAFNNLTVESFNLTVAAQEPPVFDPIANISVGETATLVVPITATDVNGNNTITLSDISLPPFTSSFADLGNGQGELTLEPAIGDAGGPFTVTLEADDGISTPVQISFDVTVTPNAAPVFDVPISNVFVGVDATRVVSFSAFDPEGLPITFTANILDTMTNPVTAGTFSYSLTDNGDGTGSVTITPQTGTAGTYTIIITADDGLEQTVSSSTLTVAVNNPPTIPNPGTQTVAENATLTVPITVMDDEGNSFTVALDSIVPSVAWISFTDLGGGDIEITANPPDGSTGSYAVTITAQDIWGQSTMTFNIDVTNTAPTVTMADITVKEGASSGAVGFTASDPEGNPITFPSIQILDGTLTPVDAATFEYSFTTNANGTGTITVEPTANRAGTYTIRITASDGISSSDNDFTLTVVPNEAPTITTPGNQIVFEGVPQTFVVDIVDTEGDPFTYNLVNILPATTLITYTDLGNGDIEIFADPQIGDTGTFTVTITASDAFATATESFDITFGNQAPQFDAPFVNVSVKEGETSGVITFSATDPEGNPITLTAQVLDGGGNPVDPADLSYAFSFTDNMDGTADGQIEFTPDVGTFGTYAVTITATDSLGNFTDSTFTLNVTLNDPPVINPIADQIMVELQVLDIPVLANDPQNDPITLSATIAPDLGFLSIVNDPLVNGAGTITLSPPIGTLGTYTVTVTADDGFGDTSITFTVTVADNRAPTIAAYVGVGLVPVLIDPLPDPITITEGEFFLVDVISADPDGDLVQISGEIFDAGNNPVSTTLFDVITADQGNGVLFFDPEALGGSAGTYELVFTSTDGFLSTSISYTLIVLDQQPPVITPIPDITITEGDILFVPLSATDAEGDFVFFEEIGTYPDFAAVGFFDLILAPIAGDAGTYTLTIGATDLTESSQTTVNVTVLPNVPPVPTPIDDVVLQSGSILDVTFVVSDTNEDELFFDIITDLPGFATLTGNVLTIAPPLEVSGSFPVTVRVSDGLAFADFSFNVTILVDSDNIPTSSDIVIIGTGSTGSNTGFNVSSTDNTGVVGSGIRGDEEAEATNQLNLPATPPVAEDDTITVLAGESILIDVTANDTIVQESDDIIGITVINQPTLGFANSEDGQIRFSAPETVSGNIALTYTVTDGTGLSSQEATVTIQVLAYDPSVAIDVTPSSQEVFEGDDAVITLTITNDGTIDLPSLSLTNVFETLVQEQPFAETTCADETFDLAVGEIKLIECTETGITSDYSRVFLLENALVSVRTSARFEAVVPNIPPVANDDAAITLTNTAVQVNVLLNDIDEDGALDPATVRVIEDLIVEARSIFVDQLTGRIELDPVENFEGDITFTYEVCDDRGDCDTATVTVTVQSEAIIPEFTVDVSKTGTILRDELGELTDQIEWVITFSNVGTLAGTNVVLTDIVDSQLSIDEVVTNLGIVVIEGQTLTVTLPSLAIGETVQVRVLTTSTVGSVSVNNEVCITGDNLTNNSCLVSDTVNIVAPIDADTQAVDGEGTTNSGLPIVPIALSCLAGAILLALAGFFIWRSRQNG